MDTKKTKIAVCISGLIRYWDATYPLFEHWNNLVEETEFVFFVSTWENTDVWYDKARVGEVIVEDIDFSKHSFITRYSKVHSSNVVLFENKKPNINFLTYSSKEVHKLRQNYEKEHGFKFDGVIQTRNDIFIPKGVVKMCSKLTHDKPYYFTDTSIFLASPIAVMGEGDRKDRLLVRNDNFFFGTSGAMDKYATMNDECVINQTVESRSCQYTHGEHIHRQGLQGYHLLAGNPLLFRDGKVIKEGRPRPDVMLKLYKEKGVDWVFHNKLTEYFVYD